MDINADTTVPPGLIILEVEHFMYFMVYELGLHTGTLSHKHVCT